MKRLTLLNIILMFFIVINVSLAYDLEVKAFGSKHGVEGVVENHAEEIILNITINYLNDLDESKIKVDDTPISNIDGVCNLIDPNIPTYACTVNLGWLMSSDCETHSVYYANDTQFKKTVRVCLDDKSPVINQFTILDSHLKSSEELSFTLDVVDQPLLSGKCAGLKSLRLKLDNGASYDYPLFDESGVCGKYQHSVKIPIINFGNVEEVSKVCAVAIDFFGRESNEVCQNITIDDQAPEPEFESFSLYSQDRSHKIGPYLQKNKIYTVVPYLKFKENSEQLFAQSNFTLFKDGFATFTFRNKLASCNKISADEFECYFDPITFSVSNPNSNYILRYSGLAKDLSNNIAEYSQDYSLYIDDIKPKVSEIKATTSIEDNFLSSDSTIAVIFDEQGCGFYDKKAYITSVAFGRKRADECYNENGERICLFKGINPSFAYNEQVVNVAITAETKDDCNNVVESTTGKNFYIDLYPPEINNIDITNQDDELFIKEGDSLRIKITGKDFSDQIFAEANFSKINGDDSIYVQQCEKNDDRNFTCELYVSSIRECSEELPIRVYDAANNSEIKTVTVNVYRRNENPSNDFWTVGEIKVYPNEIDRSLSEKMNLYAFADVEFKARRSNQNMVSFEIGECNSEIGAEVKSFYQNDYKPGSKEITFKIKIPYGSKPKTKEDVNCIVRIKTKRGETVTVNPEEENITFTIKFYDGNYLGVGDSDVVFDKIKTQYELVKSLNEFIGKYIIPTYSIAKDVCDAYTAFTQADAALNAIAIGLNAIFPGLGEAVQPVNEAHKDITPALSKFCEAFSCPKAKEEVCNNLKSSKNYFDGLTSCPDPRENVIIGVMHNCYIPPIMSTLTKYYYIETSRLGCYLDSIEQKYPIYLCDNAADEYICENALGQAIELISIITPSGYNTYSKLINSIGIASETVKNPISAAISAILATYPSTSTYIGPVTTAVAQLAQVSDMINLVNRQIEIFKDFGQGYASEVLSKYESMFPKEETQTNNENIGEPAFEDEENI